MPETSSGSSASCTQYVSRPRCAACAGACRAVPRTRRRATAICESVVPVGFGVENWRNLAQVAASGGDVPSSLPNHSSMRGWERQAEYRCAANQRPVFGRQRVDPGHCCGLGRIRQAVDAARTAQQSAAGRGGTEDYLPEALRNHLQNMHEAAGACAVANCVNRRASSGASSSSSIRTTVGASGAANPEFGRPSRNPTSQGRLAALAGDDMKQLAGRDVHVLAHSRFR